MRFDFIKCHGSGNDFVLIDEFNKDIVLSEEERIEFTKFVCDREGVIGADGVLFVQKSAKNDGKMRIFNSDGTEPEMCGNGLRCVGRFLIEALNKDTITIETMKAEYRVLKVPNIHENVSAIEIEIKTIDFNPQSLPMNYEGEFLFKECKELHEGISFSAVSITNPHIVAIVEEIDTDALVEIGMKANSTGDLLPRGSNVNFVKILGEDSIYVKTYERGVGLTQSCGTGMISSSVIVSIMDTRMLGKELKVYNDGGLIKTIVNKDENDKFVVSFTGNATYVFKGVIEYPEAIEKENIFLEDIFEDEVEAYENFLDYTRKQLEK